MQTAQQRLVIVCGQCGGDVRQTIKPIIDCQPRKHRKTIVVASIALSVMAVVLSVAIGAILVARSPVHEFHGHGAQFTPWFTMKPDWQIEFQALPDRYQFLTITGDDYSSWHCGSTHVEHVSTGGRFRINVEPVVGGASPWRIRIRQGTNHID